MTIFEITVPGTWINCEPGEWRTRVERLIALLTSRFFEANDALNLFEQARLEAREAARVPSYSAAFQQHKWENYQRVTADVRQRAGLPDGTPLSQELQAEVAFEAPVRLKLERWEAGHLPDQFSGHRSIMYARTFLLALDGFDRALVVLSKERDVPEVLKEIHGRMSGAFPDLRGVRNSAQHMEDRTRGLGESPGKGKPKPPLDLKPIDNDFVQAPDGGVLFLESLINSKFTSTKADGTLGQIEVSVRTMQHLYEIITAVLGAFNWAGFKQHLPR